MIALAFVNNMCPAPIATGAHGLYISIFTFTAMAVSIADKPLLMAATHACKRIEGSRIKHRKW
jgi:hypothetical protein